MSTLKNVELKAKNWDGFKKIYNAADKETSWKILLDEYYNAKKMLDFYNNGDPNNKLMFLSVKWYIEELEKEILNRTMKENGYK